jgi:siderophore synthetase component
VTQNSKEKYLHILLPFSRSELRARIEDHITFSESVEFVGEVYFTKQTQTAWIQLDFSALTEVIYSELSQQYSCRSESDFLKNIQDSHRVIKMIANFLVSAHEKTSLPTFIESEQSLLYGHPYHPSPKSRLDFSEEEVLEYSPEFGSSFKLHYFGVQKEFLVQESLEERSAAELSALSYASSEASSDLGLIPVHPWQAKYLLKQPEIQDALRTEKLVDFGCAGKSFYPTSSVRTVYSPEHPYFYKLSLNVRITNCIRRNAIYELQSSVEITRLIHQLNQDYLKQYSDLTLLEEPAFLAVDLRLGNPESDRKITEGFGVGLRSTKGLRDFQDVTPVLTAALFGNQKRGRTWLQQIFANASLSPSEWFRSYLALLLPPVLDLFFEKGLMFEAHLQNTLVGLKEGRPSRIFIRDFDNARVVHGSWAGKHFLASRPQVYNNSAFTEAQSWSRLVYCLVVNHLLEAVEQISRTSEEASMQKSLERELYQILREELIQYSEKSSHRLAQEKIQDLISRPFLPSKANLLTRFQRVPDSEASYVQVLNPLIKAR